MTMTGTAATATCMCGGHTRRNVRRILVPGGRVRFRAPSPHSRNPHLFHPSGRSSNTSCSDSLSSLRALFSGPVLVFLAGTRAPCSKFLSVPALLQQPSRARQWRNESSGPRVATDIILRSSSGPVLATFYLAQYLSLPNPLASIFPVGC